MATHYHKLHDDVVMPMKDYLAEHDRLIHALRTQDPKLLMDELKEQTSEIKKITGGRAGVSKASGFVQRMMAENKLKHSGQYKKPTDPAHKDSTMKAWEAFDYRKLANKSQGGLNESDYGASPFISRHFEGDTVNFESGKNPKLSSETPEQKSARLKAMSIRLARQAEQMKKDSKKPEENAPADVIEHFGNVAEKKAPTLVIKEIEQEEGSEKKVFSDAVMSKLMKGDIFTPKGEYPKNLLSEIVLNNTVWLDVGNSKSGRMLKLFFILGDLKEHFKYNLSIQKVLSEWSGEVGGGYVTYEPVISMKDFHFMVSTSSPSTFLTNEIDVLPLVKTGVFIQDTEGYGKRMVKEKFGEDSVMLNTLDELKEKINKLNEDMNDNIKYKLKTAVFNEDDAYYRNMVERKIDRITNDKEFREQMMRDHNVSTRPEYEVYLYNNAFTNPKQKLSEEDREKLFNRETKLEKENAKRRHDALKRQKVKDKFRKIEDKNTPEQNEEAERIVKEYEELREVQNEEALAFWKANIEPAVLKREKAERRREKKGKGIKLCGI